MRFSSFSLRSRALAALATLVVVLAMTGYAGVLSFFCVGRDMGAALREDREAAALISTVAAAIEDEDDVLLMSLSGEVSEAPEQVAAERARFDSARERLTALTADPAASALLAELGRLGSRYRTESDVVLGMAGSARAHALYRSELAPLVRQVTAISGTLRERRFGATEDIARAASTRAARVTVAVSIATAVALVLLAIVCFLVAKEVLAANSTLEAALEALPEVVLVTDSKGRVTRTNARARALFEEWLGHGLDSVASLPVSPSRREELLDAIRRGAPHEPPRADLGRGIALSVGGERRRFSLRASPVRSGAREYAGAVVVFDDVTDFARLDEMRTEFIAVASHELRTPLTTLRMTLALLAEASTALGAAHREIIATAELGCDQLSSTVHEFLDLATMEAGAIRYDQEQVEVGAWLERVLSPLMPRFEEQSVRLSLELPQRPTLIVCDVARLTTAVSNVLANALKYSPCGGAVAVRAISREDSIALVVDDDGPGVPASLRERVFEKYFRVEHERGPGSSKVPRGAGIGLYLCRQIVEAHRGKARCEASPSEGTRVVIDLPLGSSMTLPARSRIAERRAS